jgi:hypothetical protein
MQIRQDVADEPVAASDQARTRAVPAVLERMARYLVRPPIATDRLRQLEDGRLELQLKQAWRDGTMTFVFTPHELIERLIVVSFACDLFSRLKC